MVDTCVPLSNGDFKMVAPGSKDELRFKHGDAVRFSENAWEIATSYANSGLGYNDMCAIGKGPHTVALAKYDEKGDPVVMLKGREYLKFPFFHQDMFVPCE